VRASKKTKRVAGVTLGVIVLAVALALTTTRTSLPQLRRDYKIERGPTYTDPRDTPRYTLYIRASFSVIRARLDGWREGAGSGSSGPEFEGIVNEDSDEVFLLYPGRATLPEYPYARNEKVEPGSKGAWCTLVYRPGRGPSFTEFMSRWFK